MAQTIHCDVHGRSHPADVLVSQLANGETMAACFPGYVELARALVADAEVQAAEALAAELTSPAGIEAAALAEVDATDADALARLGAIQAAGEPAQLGELADVDPGAAVPRSSAAEALGVAQVVSKGASRSRKAHQARQRARKPKVATRATPEPSAAPGPPSATTDDPGGGPAPG